MQFTVDPATVPYSTADAQSVVRLTVTVTNDGGTFAPCSSIAATLPVSTSGTEPSALTTDASTVAPSPGPSTPWAVDSDGRGVVTALPLPPATGIAAGESVQLVLDAVLVDDAPGTAVIDVVADVDGTPEPGRVSVTKDRPATPGDGRPVIGTFTAEPALIALGGTATVTWAVEGATTSLLEPGPTVLPTPDGGTLPVTVHATTVYRLVALSTGGTDEATAVVTVMDPVIGSFTADPPGPVPAGVQVTLAWQVAYASRCSVDQGVGPVAATGSTVVTPGQTTVYTLTADGLSQASQAVTVTVDG